MKIYAISGLGADYRVFEGLKLDSELISIDWIDPLNNESIIDYSKRLIEQVDRSDSCAILGVSFGGLIAVEISKLINPDLTILISSSETKDELRWIYKVIGKTGIVNMLPTRLFDIPRNIANFIFGAENKILLKEILDDTDLRFTRWALNALTNWDNQKRIDSLIKISGSKDKIIPARLDCKTTIIEDGEHFMIVDKSDKISDIINAEIKKTQTNK